MTGIRISSKLVLIVISIAGFSTTGAATKGQVCDKGGYIKRVTMGWPHDDHVIGITIRDDNGNESNWTTNGVGDVNGAAWARSLLAMALTAYSNQTYVYPSVEWSNCSNIRLGLDGKDWIHRWQGLVFASRPGAY